jgi:hypothetical protein
MGAMIEAMMTHAGTPAEEHVPAEGSNVSERDVFRPR